MMSSFHGKTSSFLSCKTNLNHLNHNLNIANWPGGRSIGPWWGVSSPSSRDLLSFPTRTTTCNSTATWSLVRFSQLTYLWMDVRSKWVGEPDHTPLQVGNWSYDTGQKDKPKKQKGKERDQKKFSWLLPKGGQVKKNTLHVPIHNVTIQFDVYGWGGPVYNVHQKGIQTHIIVGKWVLCKIYSASTCSRQRPCAWIKGLELIPSGSGDPIKQKLVSRSDLTWPRHCYVLNTWRQ